MKNQRHLLALAALLCGGGALAQNFSLEGAVIDSRSSQSLGVVAERGDINALFRAQKAMTFGILRSAGISLEQLPPEVRARIERFATTNVEAFRAFSQGLDLKDQGRFAEAREYFRRAAELDPSFTLAVEQRQAMPDVNLGSGAQSRAIALATAGQAVDRGKATFVVDAQRAAAALSSGATVVTLPANTPTQYNLETGYTVNPAGSGTGYAPNLAVALSYNLALGDGSNFNLATSSEWKPGEYRVVGGVLESAGDRNRGFLAERNTATAVPGGSQLLGDGSTAYWGSWASTGTGNTARVTLGVGTDPVPWPTLGPVSYVIGDATRVMPTTGQVTFTPAGGSLSNVSGNIGVNFATGNVSINNLGFTIGSQVFSNLTGSTSYINGTPPATGGPSAPFSGNYSGGSCTGCAAFSASASVFGGNFIGREANGLVFSTFLSTDGANTAAGVHLFKRP